MSGTQCQEVGPCSTQSLSLLSPSVTSSDLMPHQDDVSDLDFDWNDLASAVIIDTDTMPDFIANETVCQPANGNQDHADDVKPSVELKAPIVESNPILDSMLQLPITESKSMSDMLSGEHEGEQNSDSSGTDGESDSSDLSEDDDYDSESEDSSDDCGDEAAEQQEGSSADEMMAGSNVKEEDFFSGRSGQENSDEQLLDCIASTSSQMRSIDGSSQVEQEPSDNRSSRMKEKRVNRSKDRKRVSDDDGVVVSKVPRKRAKKEMCEDATKNGEEGNKKKKKRRKKDKKRKSTMQRKNIKKIISDEKLSQEVLEARKEEQERIERQRQVYLEFKNSHLHTASTSAALSMGSSGVKIEKIEKDIDEICLSSDEDDVQSARQGLIELLSDDEEDRGRSRAITSGSGDGDFDDANGIHTDDRFNQPDSEGRVLVNVGHGSEEEDVFLSPQLSRAVKPHQIGGIRFLYANIVESVAKFAATRGVGCILAHSMGLGKTIQIIAFIDVLLSSTSAKHVLCIVPINTLQNWIAEFDMWIPKQPTIEQTFKAEKEEIQYRRFKLFVVSADNKTMNLRAKEIMSWRENGGVLLLGYEMYRLLAAETGSTSQKQSTSNTKDLMEVKRALVDPGPDVVICDEGHRIKNCKSGISNALKQIKTRRRIVLTGYPLQNNLMEYWCMVDFVRPDYLGKEKEFSNMFDKPIRNGNCYDSTVGDKLVMRRRSHVLYQLLKGFVQRRSHSILQKSLPIKFEYVFLVRLTPIQKNLLKALFRFLRETSEEDEIKVNPIILFSICNKIWNHPDVMYYIVKDNLDLDEDMDPIVSTSGSSNGSSSKKSKKKTPAKKTQAKFEAAKPFSPSQSLQLLGDSSLNFMLPSSSSASSSMPLNPVDLLNSLKPSSQRERILDYSWAEPCFTNYIPGLMSNSTKMVLLFDLMEKILQIGERLLVFSQSLLTLNLIERYMSDRVIPGTDEHWAKNFNYYRLDGSTPTVERERNINSFNRDESYKVFLLSTKAGSLGINLIGANRIILFDASWNPCHDAQAACRIYRYGQRRNCHIYRLVADQSLERKIYSRQINKQGVANRVVDELNPETRLSWSEIRSLIEGLDEFPEFTIEPFTDEQLSSISDPLVMDICMNYRELLSEKPFEHESLLLEEKETQLSKEERWNAMQEYEWAKKMSDPDRARAFSNYYNSQNTACTTTNGLVPCTSSQWQPPFHSNGTVNHNLPHPQAGMLMTRPPVPQLMNHYPPASTFSDLKFYDTTIKLRQKGFSEINSNRLSSSIHLNDKSTGTPCIIQSGEQVYLLRNPQTGDRLLLTKDCKIVSLSKSSVGPAQSPIARTSVAPSGPPVVVTLSDDDE